MGVVNGYHWYWKGGRRFKHRGRRINCDVCWENMGRRQPVESDRPMDEGGFLAGLTVGSGQARPGRGGR